MEKSCRQRDDNRDQSRIADEWHPAYSRPRVFAQRYARRLQDRAMIRQDQANQASRHRQILLYRGVAETPNGRSVVPSRGGQPEVYRPLVQDEF
jgi:hypothetical protein